MLDIKALTNLIMYLILVALVSYAVKLFVDNLRAKKELSLGDEDAITTSGGKKLVAKMTSKERYLNLKSLKDYDVKVVGAMIYDAKGYFYDDPDNVYVAFARLDTKYQLANLAGYFKRLYEIDLIAYLKTFLNTKEMSRVASIIKKMPSYMKIK